MHQTLDEDVLELHEQPEGCDARDHSIELLADLRAHELALEPRDGVPRGVVRSPLRHRAVLAESVHVPGRVREAARFLAREHVLDGAVDEQVRIATDGRGEVDVLRQREAEVATIVRLIRCARHRAKEHGLDQRVVGLTPDALDHSGEVPGFEVSDPRKGRTEGLEESLQFLELLWRRSVVYAVQRRELVATQEARSGDVGRDHALLDHPVRIVALIAADGLDATILPQLDVGLRKLEVDGAAPAPLGDEHAKHPEELFEVRQQPGMLPPQLGVTRDEHRRDLFVGEPRLGTHDAFEEARPRDLAIAPDAHLAHQAEALHPWV